MWDILSRVMTSWSLLSFFCCFRLLVLVLQDISCLLIHWKLRKIIWQVIVQTIYRKLILTNQTSPQPINIPYDHLSGLQSLSQHTSIEGESIYWSYVDSPTVEGEMPHSAGCCWNFFRLIYYITNQTNQLASSWRIPRCTVTTWTTTELFTSHGLLVFFLAFFYEFMLFDFWVGDIVGAIDHMHNAVASSRQLSKSIPDSII